MVAEAGTERISPAGAKSKDNLFFLNRLKKSCSKLIITTDDGSLGMQGFATDALKDLLSKEKFDYIFASFLRIFTLSSFSQVKSGSSRPK